MKDRIEQLIEKYSNWNKKMSILATNNIEQKIFSKLTEIGKEIELDLRSLQQQEKEQAGKANIYDEIMTLVKDAKYCMGCGGKKNLMEMGYFLCDSCKIEKEQAPEECKHKFRGYSVYPTTEYKDKGGNPLRLLFCELCGEVKDEKGDVIEPSTGKATKEKIDKLDIDKDDDWRDIMENKLNEVIDAFNNLFGK